MRTLAAAWFGAYLCAPDRNVIISDTLHDLCHFCSPLQ